MNKLVLASLINVLFLFFFLSANLFGQQIPKEVSTELATELAHLRQLLVEDKSGEPKVSVEVNYLGGDLENRTYYPKSSNLNGKQHDVNGVQVLGLVSVNDRIAIGGHWEENFLRRPRFFFRDRFESVTSPNNNLKDSNSRYQEAYLSVVLPKTGGHRLLAGVARTETKEESQYWVYPSPPPPNVPSLPSVYSGTPETRGWREEPPYRINTQESISALGPMIGLAGSKPVGRLELNWSGRIYPRMSRTDTYNTVSERSGDEGIYESSSNSWGFELRGEASYQLADHVALVGGYQHRQFQRSNEWSRDTDMERGVLGGLRFTF